MEREANGWDIALTVVLVVIVITSAWAIIIDIAQEARQYRQGVGDCVAGGYVETVEFNKVTLCIGIEDGKEAVEPLEDVRKRLEAN